MHRFVTRASIHAARSYVLSGRVNVVSFETRAVLVTRWIDVVGMFAERKYIYMYMCTWKETAKTCIGRRGWQESHNGEHSKWLTSHERETIAANARRCDKSRVYYASSVIEVGTVKDSTTVYFERKWKRKSASLWLQPTSSMSSSRAYSHVDSFVKCKVNWRDVHTRIADIFFFFLSRRLSISSLSRDL